MGAPQHGQHAGTDEREVKLAVAEGFVLPRLDQLDAVTVVDRGDQMLDAAYWDTTELALANAGVGVRHRNGVWTFKGRSRREGDAVVREELEIEGDPAGFPRQLRERVSEWAAVGALQQVARLRTRRHQVDVQTSTGSAELVHDRVSILDGERQIGRFEEVEVEYPHGSETLADRLVALLVDHGATRDNTAKYVRALRALGHHPPEVML